MDQQRLSGEEDGYSRHGDLAVSAENLAIMPAGHACCEPLPPGDARRFLAASITITTHLFPCSQPRWLDFDLDELVGQNKVSLAFVGVGDRAFPRPSKRWRVLSEDLR
jgi:hypothetical protein